MRRLRLSLGAGLWLLAALLAVSTRMVSGQGGVAFTCNTSMPNGYNLSASNFSYLVIVGTPQCVVGPAGMIVTAENITNASVSFAGSTLYGPVLLNASGSITNATLTLTDTAVSIAACSTAVVPRLASMSRYNFGR